MVGTRAHPSNSGPSVETQGDGNEVNHQNQEFDDEQVNNEVHVTEEQNPHSLEMPASQVNTSLPQSGGTTAFPHTTYTTPMTFHYSAPPSTLIRATTNHFVHPTAYATSTFQPQYPTSDPSQPTPFPQYTYPSFTTPYVPQYTAYPSQAAYMSYTAPHPPPPFTTAAPTTETYQPYYSVPPRPTGYPTAPRPFPHAPVPNDREEQEEAQRFLNVKKCGVKHFDGKTAPTEADSWLRTVERNFSQMRLPVAKWANLARNRTTQRLCLYLSSFSSIFR